MKMPSFYVIALGLISASILSGEFACRDVSHDATATLRDAIESGDPVAIAHEVSVHGESDQVTATLIRDVIDGGDSALLENGIFALSRLEQLDNETITFLVQNIDHESVRVRVRIAEAIGRGADPSSVVDAGLSRLLSDRDAVVREAAARMVGGRTHLSASLQETCVRLVRNPLETYEVRAAMIRSLPVTALSDDATIRALGELLAGAHNSARYAAASALSELAGSSKAAEALVSGYVDDEDPLIRLNVAIPLLQSDLHGTRASSELEQLSQDPTLAPLYRRRATAALESEDSTASF